MYTNTAHPEQDWQPPVLQRAIHQWKEGMPIPLTLATELMAEGFDLEELEAKYRT